jgi:hypothetical protein
MLHACRHDGRGQGAAALVTFEAKMETVMVPSAGV